ncbi:MAG: sensor histidine kinase KdpD, partial [Candidatus Latescibacterota bacterium]
MMAESDHRPDPDALLARLRREEERRDRTRLKVFLGYAPGVGKTYTMLEAARRLRDQGVAPLVGCVETHGRPETAALLDGLEVLPRRQMPHRGIILAEFDLDLALARKPAVLLLDELAHTNAPGSRHPKRWQDVLELLDAGIEVHTTVNVQHVESLNDVVAQITSVQVRETVPDAILDRADEIEVVDLPPDELLARLREGKVYLPDRAQRAVESFFRRGNLLALRELALRRAAERIDTEVRAYRREHEIETTWPAAERILACVGPSPSSVQIIRSARRMAAGLRAPWVAVYADAPDAYPTRGADRERLEAHLRLAESLGGEVARLSGGRVAAEILHYARRHNVTRIVIGKPRHSRWRDLVRGSLVSEVVRGSGEIEVHFVAGAAGQPATPPASPRRWQIDWRRLAFSVLLTGLTTGGAKLGAAHLSLADIAMLYLLAIVVAAARWGRWPALAAAALSVAQFDFFFVPPFNSFAVESLKHLLTFATMFGVGLVVSSLMARLQRQELDARRREQRTASLYSLSRELGPVLAADEAARIAAEHAAEVFEGEAGVLRREPSGGLVPAGVSPSETCFSEQELTVARWCDAHGLPAGRGTDTLPGAAVTCLPLRAGPQALGVLALRLTSSVPMTLEQRSFLEAFARQVSLTLERARLSEEAKAAALRASTEEVRSSLLSAVSHDLRTPLAAITGAGTALSDDEGRLSREQRTELLDTICSESERMERLVGNLLDMMRLESGGLTPRREWIPLEEIVGSALTRLERRLGDRQVLTDLPADLPLVHVDPVLFEQVFVNLLDNALKHTPEGSPIEVSASIQNQEIEVRISDQGPGLPAGAEEAVFEKFWRGPRQGAAGVGLGLPICRGIVLAHGGTVLAENRLEGGASFRLRLPVTPAP